MFRKLPAFFRFAALFIVLSLVLACATPSITFNSSAEQSPGFEETRIALVIESTLAAVQEETKTAQEGSTSPGEAAPTYTPYPTYTPLPTEAPQSTAPPEQPPTEPPMVNVEEKIRSANVLIFEDVRGYPALEPRVHRALPGMKFSGGRVIEVGDAVGNFMSQLNSPTQWDLIVVAAEARSGVRGEFWDVIYNQVQRGAALVTEIWYLDDIINGRISPLMSECGLKLYRDWERAPGYDVLDYSLYWLDSQHEIFSNPVVVEPLYTPTIYWEGDAGDLLALGPGGDAVLLAGTHPDTRSDHGTLATCMGGRVIFQTFSTHDYPYDKTVALWKNYMTYALKQHFLAGY